MKTRREKILDTANDLMGDFLYYGRKGDEDLDVGQIEAAIAAGEITVDEILAVFRKALEAPPLPC